MAHITITDCDASAIDRDTMVANIIGEYDRATASAKARGSRWYGRMTAITGEYARRNSIAHLSAASVYSAWSINNGWANNLRQARATLRNRQARGLGMSIRKAAACMAGSDIDRETADVTALKTRAFACNCSGCEACVTVDRWALRIAYGTGKGYVPKGDEYVSIAYAYTLAALLRDVTPATMQAVTWISIRDREDVSAWRKARRAMVAA